MCEFISAIEKDEDYWAKRDALDEDYEAKINTLDKDYWAKRKALDEEKKFKNQLERKGGE